MTKLLVEKRDLFVNYVSFLEGFDYNNSTKMWLDVFWEA
ncbi:hypothetical protein RV09_GL000852 [Enterococcus moraviensis]|nr:hypothetical protein RV09_GL000852 [Enterococcus moraviensis]